MLFQQRYTLGEGETCGYRVEVTEDLCRPNVDTFEEQDFSRERETHAPDVPRSVAHVPLLDQEVPTSVEVTQNTPAETHIPE